MSVTDWLIQLKVDKPELNEFISKLEPLISDSGFNATKFENAVNAGLKKIEEEVKKTLLQKQDAQDKKNNN